MNKLHTHNLLKKSIIRLIIDYLTLIFKHKIRTAECIFWYGTMVGQVVHYLNEKLNNMS